ncbi:MAG: hypothetical protein ACI4O0_09260 [Candidatus Limivicinus sp.]
MVSIPEPLTARFALLKQLESANDLLEAIHSSGSGTEAEVVDFLLDKICDIEEELDAGFALAEQLIDAIEGDQVAWTAARLRFMHGLEWGQVATRLGFSEPAVKVRVYRIFSKVGISADAGC